MSTLVLNPRHAIGHAGILRGYAVTFGQFQSSLLSRLLELYRSAFTFAPYRDSIDELRCQIDAAVEGMDQEALEQLAAAISPALEFLMARPLEVPKPEIDVWDSGKVGFSWYVSPTRMVDATIDGNRRLVYSAIIGQERLGRVEFLDGEWPNALLVAIDELAE